MENVNNNINLIFYLFYQKLLPNGVVHFVSASLHFVFNSKIMFLRTQCSLQTVEPDDDQVGVFNPDLEDWTLRRTEVTLLYPFPLIYLFFMEMFAIRINYIFNMN